jgi:hypothetical protein
VKKLEIGDSQVNKDCSFSPKISRKSRPVSVSRGERLVEAVTQRLAVEDVDGRKRKTHRIFVLSQPSFRPTITPTLACNARSLVHDRLYREAVERGEVVEAAMSEAPSVEDVPISEPRASATRDTISWTHIYGNFRSKI